MSSRWLLLLVLALSVALAGCIGAGDDGTQAGTADADEPADDPPDPAPPATIAGFEKQTTVSTEGSGTGVWIDHDDDLLFSTSGGGGLSIVDVSDPENPEALGNLTEPYARDVNVMEQDGEHYAVLASSSDGITIVDASNLTDPEVASTTELPSGSHNIVVVPGEQVIYNADGGGKVWGLDASNPADPEVFTFPIPETVDGAPVTSDGCHDITVRTDMGLAFCAGGGTRYGQGGGESFIWDISGNLKDPEWVSMIDDPRIFYHHQAVTNEAGDVLVINDEFIAPNCFRMEAGPVDVQTPTASAWFYDISDPEDPQQLSHIQHPLPDEPKQNCGSHFGDVIDGRNKLVMGWYQGGTMLVDFSDPADPSVMDIMPPEGSTWDARYHEGHVYTGSGDVQVLDLVGE
jgi:hypothetical protein